MPKISVCATCYNHEKFLPEFVESVKAQSYSDWELIVVDDCSTDGSWNLLQKYAAQDSRIRVFQNDRNRHMCYSGNRAAEIASGDLLVILSCDDAFLPGKFAHDSRYFAEHQDTDALYSDHLIVDEHNVCTGKGQLPEDFSRANLLRLQLFDQNSLCIQGLTLKHKVWDSIGGYNPLLRMTQDYELHLRILEDFKVARSEEPLVRYRRHSTNLSARDDDFYNTLMNEVSVFMPDHYLTRIHSVSDLLDIIPECKKYGEPLKETIPFFLSRYAIEYGRTPEVKLSGYLALSRYLSAVGNLNLVEERYNFLGKDFMALSSVSVHGSLKALSRLETELAEIRGTKGYRALEAMRKLLNKARRKG